MQKPAGTILIMLVCGAVFLAKLIAGAFPSAAIAGTDPVTAMLSLDPGGGAGVFYRMFTYAFVHSNFWHLLFNMIVLYFIARPLEERIGPGRTVLLFCAAAYFCGLFSFAHGLFVPWANHGLIMGASGAISAFLFIYWRMNPDATVLLFFIIPVPIRFLMIGIITLDFIGTVVPLRTGLAHATHLAGYGFGYLVLRFGDRMETAWEHYLSGVRRRKAMRQSMKTKEKRDFYLEQVDPILEKISKEGAEALSDMEKHILKKAGEYGKKK
jgi:membrane associated rhomboid family serine protease